MQIWSKSDYTVEVILNDSINGVIQQYLKVKVRKLGDRNETASCIAHASRVHKNERNGTE